MRCGAESRGGGAQAISHGKLNGQVSAHKAKSLYDGMASFRETLSAIMKSDVAGVFQATVSFLWHTALPSSRISGSGTICRRRYFLSHAPHIFLYCRQENVIAKITSACGLQKNP